LGLSPSLMTITCSDFLLTRQTVISPTLVLLGP